MLLHLNFEEYWVVVNATTACEPSSIFASGREQACGASFKRMVAQVGCVERQIERLFWVL